MSKTTICGGEILFTSKKQTTMHSFGGNMDFRAGGEQFWNAKQTSYQNYNFSEIQNTILKREVLILRGKRRKGKDTKNNPHLDLMHNDYPENEIGFNKLYEQIFWENITNGNSKAEHNITKYAPYQAAAANARANKVVKKIKEFCKKNNETLFKDFRNDVEYYAKGDLEKVIQSMVDRMKVNKTNTTEFTDNRLNKAVRQHVKQIEFKNNVISIIRRELNNYDAVQNAIQDLEIKDDGEGKLYPILVKDKVDSPKFPDYFDGLGIIMNDVWAYEVKISEVKTTKYPWLPNREVTQLTIDFVYYDHFGLDYPDLEKKRFPSPYIAWDHNVFWEWYVLQHYRGFVPFITKVTNSYEFNIIK